MPVDIEWAAQDRGTLGHVSVLKMSGRTIPTPHYAITARDLEAFKQLSVAPPQNNLVIAGEMLGLPTLKSVGHETTPTQALANRLKEKTVPGRLNLVYPRIPESYDGGETPTPEIGDLQVSALAGVQMEAGANMVIVPVPVGISEIKQFERIFKTTRAEVKTFKKELPIVGHIPKTEYLDLVRPMVKAYVKEGIQVFTVDFSQASNIPFLMRAAVTAIRKELKIGDIAGERDENYYIHILNVPTARKSKEAVTPLSDILLHAYGVDSTSGLMRGGPTTNIGKLRYYLTEDYGAYQRDAIIRRGTPCKCPICSRYDLPQIFGGGQVPAILERLRVHRISSYGAETQIISGKMASADAANGYEPYLNNKPVAALEVKKILRDVKEIKANLN